jgi:ferredoxin
MAHRVTLLPSGWEFAAGEEASLMEAARAAGIALPASCRNGTCRTCICRLQAGSIRHKIEWPGLSPEEKHEGWILPCVAVAASDLVLELPGARRLPA